MFRLTTLGRVDLRDRDDREVTAILVQPKRVALLLYLAKTTADGFQRRDLLLPVFWPELSQERARNALRQALHQLRHALDKDVIVSRGTDAVAVNASELWCDASAFEVALSRGALDEAVRLYRGDLLPGFALDGGTEFERWLDDTRTDLRKRAARAAWALADRHERTGNGAAAIEWARRAATIAIDDEAGLRHLMKSLDRLGDTAGALDAYADFAHRLKRDFGAAPTSETTALVDAIRTGPQGAPPTLRVDASPTDGARANVVIAPLANLTGDPAFDFIGRLVCDAIVQGVMESRMVDVITVEATGHSHDPPARGFNVTGSYFLGDESWHFQLQVGDSVGGRVLETIGDVTVPRVRPWDAADLLRRRLTGTLAGRLDPRFASWANAVAQAPDLEAHRELAIGAELHLHGDFRAAIPHLLRAGNATEGFALPILWATQASCNLEEWEQAETLLAELLAPKNRGRLSPFEKLGCDYFAACLDGQRGTALRIARLAADMVPDSEVLSQMGREALFCNHPRAAVEALERLDADRGWIPAWTPHWRRLTEALHMLGDHERELDAAFRGRSRHPEAVSTLVYETRAHAAFGDVPAIERCVEDACAFPPDRFADAGDVMLDAARELRAHGHPVDGAPFARRAVGWYAQHLDDAERRERNRRALVRANYESGFWTDADALVSDLASDSPEDIEVIGFAAAIAARLKDVGRAEAGITHLRSKTGRFRFGSQYIWIARVLAVLGETEEAVTALRGGFARGYCHGIELHSDADLAMLGGHPAFRELMRPKG